MKLKAIIAATLLVSTQVNANQGVINYINSTSATIDQKIKAEYLVNSLERINAEDWSNNPTTFASISKDINISLSCFFHSTNNSVSSVGIELVDEIQTLMTNTPRRKQAYESFMREDMKVDHKQSEASICSALN